MNELQLRQMNSDIPNSQIGYFFHDKVYPFLSIKKVNPLDDKYDKENAERLWTDCHQTFLQWVDSLRKLLEKRRHKAEE